MIIIIIFGLLYNMYINVIMVITSLDNYSSNIIRKRVYIVKLYHNGNLITRKNAMIVDRVRLAFQFSRVKYRGEFDKFGTTGTVEIPRINEKTKTSRSERMTQLKQFISATKHVDRSKKG